MDHPTRSFVSPMAMFLIFNLLAGNARAWTIPHHIITSTSISPPCRQRLCNLTSRHHKYSISSRLLATSTATVSNEDIIATILENVDESSLPLLHIGGRVGSGSYGTVHQGFLIQAKDDIQPCIAKRAWTLAELEANVPSKILKLDQQEENQRTGIAVAQRTGLATAKLLDDKAGDDETVSLSPSELRTRAERCKHYWEVERHCFQKIETRREKKAGGDDVDSRATPAFLGVHQDDGSSSTALEGVDAVQGYGRLNKDESEHKWMVFEFVGSVDDAGVGTIGEPARTLLDAMEVSCVFIVTL